MSATRTVTKRADVITTVGLATIVCELIWVSAKKTRHRHFADPKGVPVVKPGPCGYSDIVDECPVAATCIGDIAVIAGMAVDDCMVSGYR